MFTPLLATKLYVPPPRSKVVLRPRLIERLNEGLNGKLTLISAPAGFGKSTLVSEWAAGCGRPTAWLSLDDGDNDPARFLTYLVAALQTIAPNIGQGMLGLLQSPQPPPTESILTALLNEITTIQDNFILILDDCHVLDSKLVRHALIFLLKHLPPQMHLVVATREDPELPLARLRARSQLNELRVKDLRFTPSEAAEFLNQVMGLNLSAGDIAALESRTEGWVAGLQLAGISMQGHQDTANFVKSFTGSHQFVMDYLVEEVLQQQPDPVQHFLLHTSILDRLCGPLCDAVLGDMSAGGQASLQYLERANLFTIPLDDERRWYRYHHLFADLLRQRLRHSIASSGGGAESRMNELHIRASQWYEDNGLDIEAFRHAAAGQDIERAERLIDGKGIPLHFKGAVLTILDWFESLPAATLNARPRLWARHASLMLINGQTTGVEEKLQACEASLQDAPPDDGLQNLVGGIATTRAVLALTRYDSEEMIAQSHRALEYLHPNNLSSRATANWTLGLAYIYRRDFAAARRALTESISLNQAAGDIFTTILATIGLGFVHEAENQLYLAAETYRRILHLTGEQPLQIINEVHLGLARVLYEWNDLDAAEQHGRQSLDLARQYDRVIDRFINSEVFLARLKLAQDDVDGATAILTQASQTARQKNFVHRIPEVAAAQVLVLLRQGNLAAADHLAQAHHLPFSQARVSLAQGDPSAALATLESLRQQAEERGWHDERLKVMVLQALAYHAKGETDKAVQLLGDALAAAEPGGFIRLFVDEGAPMAQLLSVAANQGMIPDYIGKLLSAVEAEEQIRKQGPASPDQHLIDPLSQRELEVLQLIAQGLSNQEISERLFLALDTVKGHNRRIFDKLQVQRRTEAVARARELGLL
jgi:LuxR family maltose regulon positive regulatory protein